jgi:uncharacterized protein (TIGR02099 family)
LFTHVLKILGEVLLVVVVLAAITLGAVRTLFPYVDRYRPQFEQWGSQAIHHPIKVAKVTAAWKGLHPEFQLDNVQIVDAEQQQTLLQIQHLRVGVNIISSLWHRRLVPSSLSVSGAHLVVQQSDQNNLTVNGLTFQLTDQTPTNSDMPDALHWLLKQGNIQFDNIDVDWQDPANRLFHFTQVALQFQKGFFHNYIIGLATLSADKPTRFRFVANFNQPGADKRNIRADLYLYIRNFDIAPWLQKYSWHDFAITAGHLERLQLWATWQNNQWQQVQGVVKLKQALVSTPTPDKTLQIYELAGNIAWQRQQDGFTVVADQIKLTLNQQTLPLTHFTMWQQATSQGPAVEVYAADQLDFAQLQQLTSNFATLPAAVQTPLTALRPQATLHDVVVRREQIAPDQTDTSARFTLTNLRTAAWQHIPAIDGLSADVQVTPTTGSVQLIGAPLRLDFGELFGHPLQVNDESGTLQWQQRDDGWHIQADNLQLANDNVGLRMQLGLLLPVDGTTPFVELSGGFAERDASQIRNYLPVGLMKSVPELSTWLRDAFVTGDGVEGQVLLQGPLSHFPFDDHTGHFEVSAQVHNMDFNYKTGWPHLSDLDAELLFNDRSLDIQVAGATIMGLPTGAIHGVIDNLAHAQLNVEGNIQANSQQGLQFIAQSPLHETLGGILDHLNMDGMMQLNLALQIPFYAGNNGVKVQGKVTLSPGMVSLPAWDVRLTDFAGAFQFTEDSLTAQKLTAKWLGAPVNIQIATESAADKSHVIKTQFTGHALLNTIKKHYPLGWLKDKVQGEMDYVAALLLTKKQGKTQASFTMDSDLKGLAVTLPMSLQKSAAEQIPTHFQVDFASDTAMNLNVQYANRISAVLNLAQTQQKDWTLSSGNIRFGSQPAQAQTTPGLLIDGQLSQFIWADVADELKSLFATTDTKTANADKAPSIAIRKLDLTIDKLAAFGFDLSAANIQAQPQEERWDITINSPNIIGDIKIPKNLAQQPIVGDFDQFHFIPNAEQKSTNTNPVDIPALNLTFRNFVYGNKPFGNVVLVTSPIDNGLQIQKLTIDEGKTHVATTGRWQHAVDHDQTTISGNVHSEDIGSTLKAWGITSSVVDGVGNAAFALSWPAAPADFSLEKVNGNFSNAFTRGRIINISGSSEAEMGFGRILNLFSLQTLPRRLSLDFSDLVQKGFSFDTMKGNFTIENGNAVTQDATIEGSIAKIDIKGRIGLGAKDYNLAMTVIPSVTSSLPLAATLVGGPIAGAATWLGSKVLSGVVNKITQHTYHITGTWDNPEVAKGDEKTKSEN